MPRNTVPAQIGEYEVMFGHMFDCLINLSIPLATNQKLERF